MMANPQFLHASEPTQGDNAQGYQVQLPMFAGPLDLLLHLIEREELDITSVALAQVTDQYLTYMAVLREIEAEFLTDFLVVAAKLLFIKSQALLPRLLLFQCAAVNRYPGLRRTWYCASGHTGCCLCRPCRCF